MQQMTQDREEINIDLNECVEVFFRRKITFIAIFLLCISGGLVSAHSSPKIYRAVMKIQPPVAGESLMGENDIVSAESLRGLIISNIFNDTLRDRSGVGSDVPIKFSVVIPSETNILQVSIDQQEGKKDDGMVLMRNLVDVISDSFAKQVEFKNNGILSDIKRREGDIVNAKEKVKNLQEQIKEILSREGKLREEFENINKNTAQILNARERLLINNISEVNVSALLFASLLQNNLSYMNQLNNQFSDLSMRRANLELEIKRIDSDVSNIQMDIDKLKASQAFVENVRIISAPKLSPAPASNGITKKVVLWSLLGALYGTAGVILHEALTRKFKRSSPRGR